MSESGSTDGERAASDAVRRAPHAPRARGLALGFGALLALTLGLIVLGALVRAHGAGLACPDWPLCFGEFVLIGNKATSLEPAEVGLNVTLIDVLAEAVQRLDAQPLSDRALEATFRYRAGVALFAASRIFDSRDQLERSLEIRRELLGDAHPDTVDCRVSLSWTYHWIAGGNARAEELAREAVAALEAKSEPPDERYLHALFTLAACQFFGRDPDGGMQAARRILEILDATEQPIDFARFVPNTQIGMALCFLGRLEEAEQRLEEARADFLRQTGGQHVAKSFIDEAFGLLAARRGQWDEAERYFARAEQGDAAYRGKDTYFGSETLMIRVQAEEWRGNWSACAAIWRRILANAERSLGRFNVNTAWSARNVADCLRRAGKLAEAEEAYRYWDLITNRVEVPVSLSPDWTRYRFARVLSANGELDGAVEQFRRSIEMAIDMRGPDSDLALRAGNELAWSLWEQERFKEAEPIALEAVADYRRTLKQPDVYMINALDTLAAIQRDLGQLDDALTLFEEIRSAYENPALELGPPDTGITVRHAQCLMMLDRFDAAESMLLAIEDPPAEVIAALVELYDEWGRPEQADPWREKLPAGDPEDLSSDQ